MAIDPFTAPEYILGLKLGGKGGANDSMSSVSFAAMELSRPKIVSRGEKLLRDQDDRLEAAMTIWEKNGRISPVEIVRYDKQSFPTSRAFEEGMTLDQHEASCEILKAALVAAGAEVHFRFFHPMKGE